MSKKELAFRVHEVKFALNHKYPSSQAMLEKEMRLKLSKKLGVSPQDIEKIRIVRESIDARKEVTLSYIVDVWLKRKPLKPVQEAPAPFVGIEFKLDDKMREHIANAPNPIVIGFGPAGIFAALQLARAGLKPLVLEMGMDIDRRVDAVECFWQTGALNPASNVQFGEGGAGAFSDGKLTTRIKDRRIELVLDAFIEAGAPEDIRYRNKPHIGTDVLRTVVKQLRSTIESLGGVIRFDAEVAHIERGENDAIQGVQLKSGEVLKSPYVIAATGHSARAFYRMLAESGVALEAKPFAVGLRIEHPQVLIDAAQYGNPKYAENIGAAEYKLTHKTADGRGVYSFCMCPGGLVVASASEKNGLVVNGMSYRARDLENANSALLVTVTPEDFGSDHPLSGIVFQETLERNAFKAGGENYTAPCETVGAFCSTSNDALQRSANQSYYATRGVDYEKAYQTLEPTYRPGIQNTSLAKVIPEFMVQALQSAIKDFGQKIPGFDDSRAVLTGVESRSSAPVRILRTADTAESISLKGFYPCGEGAGYAGGITSSAVDGIKTAEHIIKKIIDNQ